MKTSNAHTEAHRVGVARMVAAGARTHGFRAELRAASGVSMDRLELMIPDAFTINGATRLVVLFEVVVTHDLDARKLQRVRSLRDRLAMAGWALELRAVHFRDAPRIVDLETGRAVITMDDLRSAIDRLAAP
jgi:hypothetical protein